ncbi:TPA: translation initiation factor IF-2 subunit gamma [Candidatus Micrarchaeota archaeon]|nr:translation initiation factor IF-2 subunit gamma [Candidatus Micrarchaeota archaeon]
MTQAELNIGTIGHVDHGKSTLVQALTGKFPDTHSEELKRGITIKLGYSQATFYKCPKCPEPQCYSTQPKCPNCGSEGTELRKVSFLDSPGHETLMATVIAASSIMDGALFVIAANEECPQPQTVEHLMILEAAGIKNVIVVQNKVDLVAEEKAKTHYKQIKEFLKGSLLENAPVIPVVANVGGNLDALIQAIQETIPLPTRPEGQIPRMLVARSFDVNKPGTDIPKLSGGVLGGSIVQGEFKIGQEIMILPGSLRIKKNKEHYEPLTTKIAALFAEKEKLTEAKPGGLVAVGTQLDPALTHSDSLVGNVIGLKDSMPPVYSEITVEIKQMPRLLQNFPAAFKPNEPLVLGAGTATTVGFVIEQKKKGVKIVLKKPICLDREGKLAVLRRAENRWRLYGTAKIVQ